MKYSSWNRSSIYSSTVPKVMTYASFTSSWNRRSLFLSHERKRWHLTILPWCIHALALFNSSGARSFNKCLCSIGDQRNVRHILKEMSWKLIGAGEFCDWSSYDMIFVELSSLQRCIFLYVTFHLFFLGTSKGDQAWDQNPASHYYA